MTISLKIKDYGEILKYCPGRAATLFPDMFITLIIALSKYLSIFETTLSNDKDCNKKVYTVLHSFILYRQIISLGRTCCRIAVYLELCFKISKSADALSNTETKIIPCASIWSIWGWDDRTAPHSWAWRHPPLPSLHSWQSNYRCYLGRSAQVEHRQLSLALTVEW